jgi:hypothetical protein
MGMGKKECSGMACLEGSLYRVKKKCVGVHCKKRM